MLLLLAETLLLALVAGLLGVALGYLIAALLLPDVAATLAGLYGATVPGSLALRPDWVLTGLAIAFGGALLATGQGLWRIATMPLLAPAQPRAWAMASRRTGRWSTLAALALLLTALLTAWLGSGLASGFLTLAALLLGAALIAAGDPDPAPQAGCAHRALGHGRMDVGRHAPAGPEPVAGADGADAGARRQCRRRHHGRLVPPYLHRLARPAPGFRTLCDGGKRDPGYSDARLSRRPRRCRAADAVDRGRDRRPAGLPLRRRRPPDLPAELAAARTGRQCLGPGCRRQRRTGQRAAFSPRRPPAGRSPDAGARLDGRNRRRLFRLRQSDRADESSTTTS